jgi:hypothetical protein
MVQPDGRVVTVEVAADGDGLVSRAGTALIAGLADRLGVAGEFSEALAGTRQRAGGHDPGRVLADLAVMLADGGDCVADLGALRDQPQLFGTVASGPTAWRTVQRVDEALLDGLRDARARVRARAWAAGARPERVVLDFDSHLITSHSEKEGAAATWKRGFGFHPLLCYLDDTGEALAGVLREGNAGSNTAADHIRVLELALQQLPADALDGEILARSDSAGASHDFAAALAETSVRFSLGFAITQTIRDAILGLPEAAWARAISQDGEERDGAWVTELTGLVDLAAWPAGSRLIVRRERPHPGAQLSFSDIAGHRFQCVLTDQDGDDLASIEARHRAHARVEDRIRCARDTGLRNLPFSDFEANACWLELVLCAQDLICFTQRLLLDGELAVCEPKRLRYRLLHVAGRVTRHARSTRMRLPRCWPWATALLAAFTRLRALPAPG